MNIIKKFNIFHKSFKVLLDKLLIMYYNTDRKRKEEFKKMKEDTPPAQNQK